MEKDTPQDPAEKKNKEQTPPPEDSSLHMLKRQLYARDESQELTRRVKSLNSTHPRARREVFEKSRGEQPTMFNLMKVRSTRRKKMFIIGGAVVLVAIIFSVAVAGSLIYRRSQQVNQDHLQLSVEAPEDFTAGEDIIYTVRYKNTSRVDWVNVEVLFEYPPGLRLHATEPEFSREGNKLLLAVGDVKAGEEKTATISGQLIGEQQSSVLARAELSISPANVPKVRISNSATASTTIVAVPLEVTIQASKEASEGERLLGVIQVRNTSSKPLEGALLRVRPAVGLQLATEDEEFSPEFSLVDSWWVLPRLEPLQEVNRQVVMYVEGQAGEKRTLEAQAVVRQDDELYVLRTVNHVIALKVAALQLTQSFNNETDPPIISPGQKIQSKITYKNSGTSGLRNVIAAVAFEGTGLNPATLKLKGGAYNPTTKTITWTAASVPELSTLQPQQTGTLEYEFAVLPLSGFPTGEFGKNLSLIVLATIESPDIPAFGQADKTTVVTSRAVMPIKTDLTLDIDAFYDDGRLGLASTGPLPPKVGEQTTYTLRFRLGSTFNDVGDVRLQAVLPDGVDYTNKTYVTTGSLTFDERSRQIIWSIPLIEGLSGRAAVAPELLVQVGITPGENLRGQDVLLLQQAQAEGLDLFTDVNVTVLKNTDLPTTETAAKDQGEVE